MRRRSFPGLRAGLIVICSTLALLVAPPLATASSIDVLGAAAHTGAHGARVSVTSLGDAYVRDESPDGETSYVVRYYTNPSNLSIDPNDENATLDQFVAFNELDTEQFWVGLKQTGCLAGDDDLVLSGGATVTNEDREACNTITATNTTVSGNVTFRAGDSIALGSGFEAGGSFTAEVGASIKNGETRAFVTALTNSGTTTSESSEELVLPTGWNAIEVSWLAATSPGNNNGEIDICVNGTSCLTSPLVHDHAGQIDFVQWRAQAVGTNTSGSMDLDDFDSRRAGPIGLLP